MLFYFLKNNIIVCFLAFLVSGLFSLVSPKAPVLFPPTGIPPLGRVFYGYHTVQPPFPSGIRTVAKHMFSPSTGIPPLGMFSPFGIRKPVLSCGAKHGRPSDRRCGAGHSTIFFKVAYSCTLNLRN